MVDVVSSVLQLASRRRLRAFLQPDPVRPVRLGHGVPAARPVHHRLPAGDAADPAGCVQRHRHPVHRAGRRFPAGRSAFHRQHRSGEPGPAGSDGADQGAARHHPHLGGPAGRGRRRWRRRGPGHRGCAVPVRRRLRRGLQGDLPGRGGRRRPAAAGPADRAGRPGAEDDPQRARTRSATGGSSCTSPAARSPCPGRCRCCRRWAPTCWTSDRSRSAGPTEASPASTISGSASRTTTSPGVPTTRSCAPGSPRRSSRPGPAAARSTGSTSWCWPPG